jgi:hypothetical protein
MQPAHYSIRAFSEGVGALSQSGGAQGHTQVQALAIAFGRITEGLRGY